MMRMYKKMSNPFDYSFFYGLIKPIGAPSCGVFIFSAIGGLPVVDYLFTDRNFTNFSLSRRLPTKNSPNSP